MLLVLDRAYEHGITVQSNYARYEAASIAACASAGLLTTVSQGEFGRTWRPTQLGMQWAELGSWGVD